MAAIHGSAQELAVFQHSHVCPTITCFTCGKQGHVKSNCQEYKKRSSRDRRVYVSDQTGDLSPDTRSSLDVINEAFDAYVKPALHTTYRFQPLVDLDPETISPNPWGVPRQPFAPMSPHRRGATGGTTRHSAKSGTPVRDSGGSRRSVRNRKRSRARVSDPPAEDPPLDLRITCDNTTSDKTAVRLSHRVDAEVCVVKEDAFSTGIVSRAPTGSRVPTELSSQRVSTRSMSRLSLNSMGE
ncbi:hypothetical protein Bbelb_133730 [Branchiostoma belcheri]|nr:hypothetical protein Bbelb_133730 [Branchiostoma belcheri]